MTDNPLILSQKAVEMLRPRIAIIGSRGYCDKREVEETAGMLYNKYIQTGFIFVSGGCPNSPDQWAEDFLRKLMPDDRFIVLPADWETHGKAAGFVRNVDVAKIADEAYAFWLPRSPGTKHTINEFIKRGKPLWVRIRS